MVTIVKILRFIYITMSYFLICDVSSVAQSQTPFFTSLSILALGMLCDYAGLTVNGFELKKKEFNSGWQIFLGIVGIIFGIIALITGIGGLSQNLTISEGAILKTKDGFVWDVSISLVIYLKALSVFVFLSAFEIFNNPKRAKNNIQLQEQEA